jgi:hypothetical protein
VFPTHLTHLIVGAPQIDILDFLKAPKSEPCLGPNLFGVAAFSSNEWGPYRSLRRTIPITCTSAYSRMLWAFPFLPQSKMRLWKLAPASKLLHWVGRAIDSPDNCKLRFCRFGDLGSDSKLEPTQSRLQVDSHSFLLCSSVVNRVTCSEGQT